jgi:cytochrome c oxidase assembly factor CtaG
VEPPLTGSTFFSQWQFAPLVTGLVVAAAAAYVYGVLRVRRAHPTRPWPALRTASFLAGLLVLVLATESSIGAYDNVLFWVHMLQHLLLIMVAPALLIAGRPIVLLLHASRNPLHTWAKRAVRSRTVNLLTNPGVAFCLYTAVIVGTHLTSFMNTVLTHPAVHDLEHVLYVVVGYLFFLPLLGSEPIRWKLSFPGRFLYLALAMPVDTFVGVVLGQTNHELFPAYTAAHRTWGPSPVGDLHAGGAVMWVGGDALMLAFMLLAFVAYLRDSRAHADVGAWLEEARRNTLADQAAAAGVSMPKGRGSRRTADEDDRALAEYNAYLAALARRAGESVAGSDR